MSVSTFSGLFDALDFAYGTAFSAAPALQVLSGSTTTGAYTITCSPTILKTKAGVTIPITVNTPITIGSNGGYETVTPTAVTTNQLNQILITATFTYAHSTGAQVRSGTYGLQEAAQQAVSAPNPGGMIALSPAWFKANGGHSAGITALTGQKSLATTTYVVLDYSGIAGAVSYAAASGSDYASTTHVIY